MQQIKHESIEQINVLCLQTALKFELTLHIPILVQSTVYPVWFIQTIIIQMVKTEAADILAFSCSYRSTFFGHFGSSSSHRISGLTLSIVNTHIFQTSLKRAFCYESLMTPDGIWIIVFDNTRLLQSH